MNKLENKIGISLGAVIVILFFLMSFGGDIESLNKEKIFTPSGTGEGVFYSLADFLTYNVFIIGCVLSVFYVILLIDSRSKK